MQNVTTLNGMVVNAKTEIENKIVSYLKVNNLTVRDDDGAALLNGLRMDADYSLYTEGTFDNVCVELRYKGFKPERVVKREIMALDERIDNIHIKREYSEEVFNNELLESIMDTVFVMIDGQLQQTTIEEYTCYKLRNRVFTKK